MTYTTAKSGPEVDRLLDLAQEPLSTEVDFNARVEQNKNLYAGSGFIEYGKRYDSSSYAAVNEGMQSGNQVSGSGLEQLYMGSDASGTPLAGVSRNPEPLVSVNGVTQKLHYVDSTSALLSNAISFPPAPDGTATYDSTTGVKTVHVDTATAFASLEKAVNGDFATDTDWTKGTGWTIAGGVANKVSGVSGTFLTQAGSLIEGADYEVGYTVSNYTGTGNFSVRVGGFSGANITADGTYTEIITAGSTGGIEIFAINSGMGADFENISVTKVGEDVITSRKDFVMLESWHEVISDKGVVYPLGNVQYGATTWEGITLSNGLVAQGYSAFGEWDAVTKGYGATWSALSEANKATFLADPENNIYLNVDGDYVQVRYRVRVIEGLGDDWSNVDPQSIGIISYDSNSATRVKIRQGNTTVDDFSSTINLSYRASNDAEVALSTKNAGLYGVNDDAGVDALRQFSAAIPIALVQRRNLGTYHPSFNPFGTGKQINTTVNGWVDWYSSVAEPAFSTEQCLTRLADGGLRENNGAIGDISGGTAGAGRPDELYYNAIYAADVTDLRNSARADDKSVDYWLNKAVANDLRHYVNEGTPYTVVKNRGVVEAYPTNTLAGLAVTVGDSNDFAIGDFVVFINQANVAVTYGYVSGVTSSSPDYINLTDTYTNAIANVNDVVWTRTLGDVYTILKVEYQKHERETLTWTDVIGDPANYPRQWTGVIDWTTADGSQTVTTGSVVEITAAPVAGTIGNIYMRIGADLGPIDLATLDYTTTATWTDLGTKAEFLANAKGFEGFPLLYGEGGEDLIPDGTLQAFKMSRKVIDAQGLNFTDDGGVNWTHSTTWDAQIEGTNNSNETTDVIGRVRLVNYETPAHIFTDSDNAAVFDAAISNAKAAHHNNITNGVMLSSEMIGKISVSGVSPYAATKTLEDYVITSSLKTDVNFKPTHTTIGLSSSTVSPAVKSFAYQVEASNQLMLNAVYKEMIFDVDWGDDNQFVITDDTTAATDDNGNTILVGTKQTKLPFFVREES